MWPPGAAAPARKRPFRAHVTCGANLALESAGDLGEARPARDELPGLSPDMQTRRLGGFCYFRGWGLAASRKSGRARGPFRALREPASVSGTEQPGRLCACAHG